MSQPDPVWRTDDRPRRNAVNSIGAKGPDRLVIRWLCVLAFAGLLGISAASVDVLAGGLDQAPAL